MKILIIGLLVLISVSFSAYADVCTFHSKAGSIEKVVLHFESADGEIVQIQFSGTEPDRYFALSKVNDGGLTQEFTQFATRRSKKSPLLLEKKNHSQISIQHVKGGNIISWIQNGQTAQFECSQKQ